MWFRQAPLAVANYKTNRNMNKCILTFVITAFSLVMMSCVGTSQKNTATDTVVENSESQAQQNQEANNSDKTESTTQSETGSVTQNNEKSISIDKFVGTYWLDFGTSTSRFNNNPIVVLEDGRCVIVYETAGGSKSPEYLGEIEPLTETTFTIKGDKSYFGPKLYLDYIDAEGKEHKYSIITRSGKEWRRSDPPIFDLSTMRVYKCKSEYRNRDISKAYYTTIKNVTSSTSLNQ